VIGISSEASFVIIRRSVRRLSAIATVKLEGEIKFEDGENTSSKDIYTRRIQMSKISDLPETLPERLYRTS